MVTEAKAGLTRGALQLVISLVVLFFLRIVLSALPVVSDSAPIPGFDVSAVVLAKALVDTFLLAAGLVFGRQASLEVQKLRLRVKPPRFPWSRDTVHDLSLIMWLTFMVVGIGIAYKVYQDVALGLLDGDLTLYSWVFLIAILLPLVYLGFLIFKNLEPITDAIMARSSLNRVVATSERGGECPKCGEPVRARERFCAACGANLEVEVLRKQKGTRSEGAGCPSCGEPNSSVARFCRVCGASLEGIRVSTDAVCPECGRSNAPEALFCRHCGKEFGSTDSSASEDREKPRA